MEKLVFTWGVDLISEERQLGGSDPQV